MASSAMTTSARMAKIKASHRSSRINSSFKEGIEDWGIGPAGISPGRESTLGKFGRSLSGRFNKDGSRADFSQQLRSVGGMTGHFNGRLPDSASDMVVSQTFEKLCSGDKWQARLVVVTQFDVLFARDGERRVIDSIPIHEIEDVAIEQGAVDPKIHIMTSPSGYNSGRPYVLRVSANTGRDVRMRLEMAEDFAKKLRAAQDKSFQRTKKWHRFAKYQQAARKVYISKPVQILIASLIVANFVFSAVEAEIHPLQNQPPDYSLHDVFNRAEVIFTIVFLVELLVNVACHGSEFYSNSWNLFDLTVVTTSLVSLASDNIPGINVLRLLRAFRVLRLFGRLGAQRRIINAISSSALPVVNALIIVLLVMCIYAIMGVEFFGKPVEQGGFGAIEFDRFSDALFTMFQVATFEGWAEIARPLFGESGRATPLVAVYFTTYIALISWILLPVVVALLLDNFSTMALREQLNLKEAERQQRNAASSSIDPLLGKLAAFRTEEELESKIQILYRILDVDESQGLSYTELSEGLKKLNFSPGIHLSREDFDVITLKGALCDENDELDVERFGQVIKYQLRLFVERNLSSAMQGLALDEGGNDGCVVVSSLKMVMMQLNRLEDEFRKLNTTNSDEGPCALCGGSAPSELSPSNRVTYQSAFGPRVTSSIDWQFDGRASTGLEAHPSKSPTASGNSISRQIMRSAGMPPRSSLGPTGGAASGQSPLPGQGDDPSATAPVLLTPQSAVTECAQPLASTPASMEAQPANGSHSPSQETPRSLRHTPRARGSVIVPLPKPKGVNGYGGGGTIARSKPMGAAFEMAMSGGLKGGQGGGGGLGV